MIFRLFSVYDVKAKTFSQPFMVLTHGQAERMFIDEVNREDSMIHKHPEDYSLFYIAQWNDEDASYSIVDRECVMTALDVVGGSNG